MRRTRRSGAFLASVWLAAACAVSAVEPTAAAPAINGVPAPTDVPTSRSAGASPACSQEAEPNDTEDQAAAVSAPGCMSGTLPNDDQDLFLWELPDTQPPLRWTISLTGVLGTVSSLRVLPVTSDPGAVPITVGNQLVGLSSTPEFGSPPAEAADLLLAPGRYLVGISRSGTPDGSDPVDFGYSFSITNGAALPPVADHEPNDDPAHAGKVAGSFTLAGDASVSQDFFQWTLSPEDAAKRWELSTQPQLAGTYGMIVLTKPSGDELARTTPEADGRTFLHDLALSPGKYLIEIGDNSGTSTPEPYVLTASEETGQASDPEPNNDPATAVALDPQQMIAQGRLSQSGDRDDYRLRIDDQHAATLLDIRLTWAAGPGRQLCVIDDAGNELACRRQDDADLLANLFLPVGDYTIDIAGDPDPTEPYLLRVSSSVAPQPDFETEPNDTPITASTWMAGVTMRGREAPGDVDYFKVTTAGAPQLFLLEASGTEIDKLDWYRRDGTDIGTGEVAADHSSASLEDMYLVPGDHWIRIDAIGDYSLVLTPEGPPDPNGEREPNDSSVDAQPLALGVPRTGRLVRNNDIDVSRFSLQAAERLRLSITPPADGAAAWGIFSGNQQIARARTSDVGAPVVEDLSLPAGDYELWLEPGTVSKSRYSVELDREDPWEPAPSVAATIELSLDAPSVAAYWSAGQHVTGHVTVSNTGTGDEALDLEAVTSNNAWVATLGQTQLTLAPGASTAVSLDLTIQPDAWADVPVRISVRARDATGGQATGHVEMTPGRIAPPVDPEQIWSVPDALLGGLDVASLALGGIPIPTYDPAAEAQLYDGLTPAGAGFGTSFSALPVTLTTDLAGDEPVPVSGMILNPQALNADMAQAPKDVQLWLSTDGANWTEAFSGQMSPLPIDQSFVLAAPVAASFAQLRITSLWVDGGSEVALGEFKVVAAPGIAPAKTPINVAALAAGGHIVWMDPQSDEEDVPPSLLDEDLGARSISVKPNVRPSWVLGFQDDRAALLTAFEWVDPTDSVPEARTSRVDIATSLDGPLGPWTAQGSWQLTRASDGTIPAFSFPTPQWARFVRFTADAKKVEQDREQPGVLRAIEAPTTGNYRSVLGEYGATPAGDYEIQNPPPLDAPSYAHDANDTPDAATPLGADAPVSSTAHAGDDVDWYDLTVPDGQNTLAFTVRGAPSVGVGLRLQDDAGASVPMHYEQGDEPGTVSYSATVTPRQHYRIEVQQPPFSAVFTYDTSGSMSNYLSFVFEAIRTFAAGVQPGEQAAQIVPFEEPPLLPEWSEDPYALQDAIEGVVTGEGSSSAETALINAINLLAAREGAKAILLVTDAETSSFTSATALWNQLGQLRPQIIAVQVGADSTLAVSGHYMQDWAQSSGGFYQYTHTHIEMDRAFDRMATWLERPTEYTLSWSASFVKPAGGGGKPGTLVVIGANGGDPSTAPVAANAALELILDTSGSMLDRLEGTSRIEIAKSVLTHLVRDKLPAGVPLALRVFGDTPNSCDTRLAVPLGPLDPAQVTGQINGVHVLSSVNTPIGSALKQVASDLAGATGPRIVVLMTDGEENCGGNPAAAVRALVKSGVDVHVNIVGFQIGQRSLRAQMASWAKLGHGSFFNATSSSELNGAVALAISAPYQVIDQNGNLVATGTVNGAPLSLRPGSYHVTVLTDPPVQFDAVIEPDQALVLSLPSGG
jgi:hypothetical protein